MATIETLPDRDMSAIELARSHFRVEPVIEHIHRLIKPGESDQDRSEPIKLLESNPDTFKAGIQPIYFPSRAEFKYPSIIIEVTPDEYLEILSNPQSLPNGWILGQEISR